MPSAETSSRMAGCGGAGFAVRPIRRFCSFICTNAKAAAIRSLGACSLSAAIWASTAGRIRRALGPISQGPASVGGGDVVASSMSDPVGVGI